MSGNLNTLEKVAAFLSQRDSAIAQMKIKKDFSGQFNAIIVIWKGHVPAIGRYKIDAANNQQAIEKTKGLIQTIADMERFETTATVLFGDREICPLQSSPHQSQN